MGTLVGGASTIGTAQLAYSFGFSAWWFTLGAGLGCVMLAAFYVLASVLTEILSNNAVAALMTPLALSLAVQLGVDPRPFVIAVCIAASAAFATPIGYQTNTYVYGVGGYRFADFIKFGLPLNVICFVIALYVIPAVWPF